MTESYATKPVYDAVDFPLISYYAAATVAQSVYQLGYGLDDWGWILGREGFFWQR